MTMSSAESVRPSRLLLVSGLSLTRGNSFSVQLDLLSRALERLGCECTLIGAAPKTSPFESRPRSEAPRRHDLPELTIEHVGPEIEASRAGAIVLLGYPDQFPFLGSPELAIPAFLWSQFSRPPKPLPHRAIIVPLTATSGRYALEAGAAAIEPPIPHGVDTSLFAPLGPPSRREARSRLGLPVEAFVVGYVGTNQSRKRHDRLFEAFALLHARRRETHLCVKSDRLASSLGFDLAGSVRRLGLEEASTFVTSRFGEKRIAELIGCFDLYLHVAEWEGFGIPVIEALACGVPVVTHDGQGPGEITPFPELIAASGKVADDTGAGLAFVDPESAADATCRVIDLAPEERAALSVRARRAAVSRFDVDLVAKLWLQTIRRRTLPTADFSSPSHPR